MTWIKEMAEWVAANGFGTLGSDLFYGTMPDTVNVPGSVMALLPYAGRGPDYSFAIGSPLVTSDFPRFAVQCRDQEDEYDLPYERAMAFYAFLQQQFGVIVGSTYYKMFTVLTFPAPIAGVKEETGRWLIGFNVEADHSP